MKKKIILLGVITMSLLGGCNNIELDNTLPMKQVSVGVDYGTLVTDKATVTLSEVVHLNNKKLLDKFDTSKEIKNLLPGDNLEIYYKNDTYENINHVLVEMVDELSEIQVTNAIAPGSDTMEIFVEYNKHPGIVINYFDIKYVINEDQTYTPLNSLGEMFMDLYGTYKESEITAYTSGSFTIERITLIALYSYPPRIN